MASHEDEGRHQDEGFDGTRKGSKFVKIILENTIPEGKFRIPMKFVRKYGNCLSSPITLKVPTGMSWQVELLKIENEIWVQNGLQEFAEYHSLMPGHLLVFIYEGDCNFEVRIFGTNGSEIQYPNLDFQQLQIQENEVQDDVSCEILDSDNGNQSTKKDQDDISCEILDPGKGNLSKEEDQDDVSCEILNDSISNVNQSSEDPHVSISESEAAINNSVNNPSFELVLRSKSTVVGHSTMPFRFIKRYMGCHSKTLMLQVAEKSWPVKLHIYSDRATAIISGGWAAFTKENSLKVGDVCKFELIKNDVMIASKL